MHSLVEFIFLYFADSLFVFFVLVIEASAPFDTGFDFVYKAWYMCFDQILN